MVFKKWNIIYHSKKVYNDLKIIEKNTKPLYKTTPNFSSYYFISLPSLRFSFIDTLNKIEESVNNFQKAKIEDIDCSFHEEFPAIASFIYEAYYYEEKVKNLNDKKFVNIALKLDDKIDCYKSMDIFSKVLIITNKWLNLVTIMLEDYLITITITIRQKNIIFIITITIGQKNIIFIITI